jgi:microcystin-dependent protein
MTQVESYQVPPHPSGLEMRTQLNAIVQAILTQSSGPTEPTETYPGMIWADTTAGIIKQRTQDNTAWTDLYAMNRSPGVPAGTIIMWWGDINNIPKGYVLCDGNNGTPNMLDRVPIGAGYSYAVGAMGGRTAVALTTSELPWHDHGIYDPGHNHYFNDPGHAHGVSDWGHQHSLPNLGSVQAGSDNGGANIPVSTGYGSGRYLSPTDAGGGNHSIYGSGTGAWNSASGIGCGIYASGGGAAFDIRPPYLAVWFLMKV